MANTAQWFDLSEFKASLKLLPYNEHRQAKICIVFDNIEEFVTQVEDKLSRDEIGRIGFDLPTSQLLHQYQPDSGPVDTPFVLYSNNDFDGKIDLKTLQAIFPSLNKSHLKEMEMDQFTNFDWVYSHKHEWGKLYQFSYNTQFTDLWKIQAAEVPMTEFNPNHPGVFSPIKRRLEVLGYDINAMVTPLFVNKDGADKYIEEFGIQDATVLKVATPYALPLQLDRDRNIAYAIEDIRSLNEIVHSSPYSGLNLDEDKDLNNEFKWPLYTLRANVEFDQQLMNCLEKLKPALAELSQALNTDSKDDLALKKFQFTARQAISSLSDDINDVVNIRATGNICSNLEKHSNSDMRSIANLGNLLDSSIANYSDAQYLQEVDNVFGLEKLVNAIQHAAAPKLTDFDASKGLNEKYFSQLLDQLSQRENLGENQLIKSDNEEKFELTSGVGEFEEEVKPAAKTKPLAPPKEPNTDSNKIEDVGEHIGGARKDFYKSALKVSDIDSFNEREKEELITKNNIWPAINYEKLKELGFEAKAVTAIKVIKDSLPIEPGKHDRRKYPVDDQKRREYISAVATIRNVLMGDLSADELECNGAKTFNDVVIRMAALHKLWAPNKDNSWGSGCSNLHMAMGRKACTFISPVDVATNQLNSAVRKVYSSKQKTSWRDGIDYEKWNHLIKEKVERSDKKSEEINARKLLNDLLHNPAPEHLDLIISETKWREGRDVTEHELLERFNFKGIEFGNWVPQNERQIVVNYAYDGFCDLAEVLGIEDKNIGLEGNLSLGFGSRGRGGRNAALAHYEPSRHVINLTRLKGAGTLSHEYFHALDDYLGGYSKRYASEESGAAFNRVILAAKRANKGLDEQLESKQAAAIKHTKWGLSWVYKVFSDRSEADTVLKKIEENILPSIKQDIQSAVKETLKASQLKEFDTTTYLSVDEKNYFSCKKRCEETLMNMILNAVSDSESGLWKRMDKKSRDQLSGNFSTLLRNAMDAEFITEAKAQGFEFSLGASGITDSKFYLDAKKLDDVTGRTKPYWATTKELLARAGAAYVHDKLAESNKQNQYLVNGSAENAHEAIFASSPNPQGEDRTRINAAFEEAFMEIRHHFSNVNAVADAEKEVKLNSETFSM